MKKVISIDLTINQIRYIITALGHVGNMYQKEIESTGAEWAYDGKQDIEALVADLKREVEDHE